MLCNRVFADAQKHNTRNQFIKNYSFDFDWGHAWGRCEVTMTAVTGHLTNYDFTSDYKNWSHPPPEALFTAPVVNNVYEVSLCCLCVGVLGRVRQRLTLTQDKKNIAKNIADQARYCRLLVIWTDCDREGEHIGKEIVDAARRGKPDLEVKRARFSNVERA